MYAVKECDAGMKWGNKVNCSYSLAISFKVFETKIGVVMCVISSFIPSWCMMIQN